MYKNQEINQEELECFDTAKCTLWEAYCLLEMMQERLLNDNATINTGTALKGVVKMIERSVNLLEEI